MSETKSKKGNTQERLEKAEKERDDALNMIGRIWTYLHRNHNRVDFDTMAVRDGLYALEVESVTRFKSLKIRQG